MPLALTTTINNTKYVATIGLYFEHRDTSDTEDNITLCLKCLCVQKTYYKVIMNTYLKHKYHDQEKTVFN